MTLGELRQLAATVLNLIDDYESQRMLISEQSLLIHGLVASNGGVITAEAWDSMSEWFVSRKFCPHSRGLCELGVVIGSSEPQP
jgi:hypothetical protein